MFVFDSDIILNHFVLQSILILKFERGYYNYKS